MDLNELWKCLAITLFSIVGAFLMFGWDLPLDEGFVAWGFVVFGLLILGWYFGMFETVSEDSNSDQKFPFLYYTTLLNGIMINFGGYLILVLLVRFNYGIPTPLGGM